MNKIKNYLKCMGVVLTDDALASIKTRQDLEDALDSYSILGYKDLIDLKDLLIAKEHLRKHPEDRSLTNEYWSFSNEDAPENAEEQGLFKIDFPDGTTYYFEY